MTRALATLLPALMLLAVPRASAQDGECTRNSDCDDYCVCTADVCILWEERCEHVVICDMCYDDRDCDDANPCTYDFCVPWDCGEFDGLLYRCEFEWNPECGEPDLPEYVPEPAEIPEPDMEAAEEIDTGQDGDSDPGEGTLRGGGCGCTVR